MTASYNKKIYGQLLVNVLPSSIDSDEEYNRVESIFNNLWNKKKLSPEEERLFHLLADLLEDYGKKSSRRDSTFYAARIACVFD